MDSETLFLERARTLLPQVLPFVKWAYLHAAPSLPTSAVELIECLEKLGMNQGAESMRSDFTDYFADQVHRLSDKFPDGGMGPELAEFCFQANKRFGPFSEDVEAIGDFDIVRGRMIEQLEGLRNTFRKPSPTNDGRTPSPPPAPNVEQAVVNGGANSTDRTPPPQEKEFVFAIEGDGYYLAGFGESGHFRRLKGLNIIARLIQRPGIPVAMVELVGDGNDERLSRDLRSRQETLDNPARTAIRNRLAELHSDYEKAKADNSTVEMDLAEKEIANLESQLSADIGIAGRSRDINSEADKLRPRIHGCLKTIYKTLRDTRPPMNELANHFEGAISSESGAFVYCAVAPINWMTSPLVKK